MKHYCPIVRITTVTNTDKAMTEPRVELKNVRSHYSNEWGPGGAFEADIWINGVKCMHVNDEGNGGCYDYEPFSKDKIVEQNIKLFEDYINAKYKGKFEPMDMYIVKLVDELEKAKAKKKLLKEFEKSFCFGVPNGNSYRTVYWKGRTLAQIDKINLQRAYNNVKAKLGKGEVILNTNLQALGINL